MPLNPIAQNKTGIVLQNFDGGFDSGYPNGDKPSSDLDTFGGSGALVGYTTNNASDLPDVTQVNGRYRANLTNNSGDITLHYNSAQGRNDAKSVSFPFTAIVRNIGIGTQADSQIAPSSSGSPFIFAGLQVHANDWNLRNSSHVVIGHRGSTGFTCEGKNTRTTGNNTGTSSVTDEGADVLPLGRADIRIVGNADNTLTVSYQAPNTNTGGTADNWILYNGNGNLPDTAPIYSSPVYVGLITYAQGSQGVPFLGTCDSFELTQN